jgi:precorrin-8X/cobalt-precorrin-8 methylmutase
VTETWLKDPEAIYRLSFARARAETDLSGVAPELHDFVLRLVHACARPEIAADVIASEGALEKGLEALRRGAPIVVDSRMTAAGITRSFLPPEIEIACVFDEKDLAKSATAQRTTRAAAAIERFSGRLNGAIVAVGNAPTALFRLIEIAHERSDARPALILGFPVGFVGAAESKDALVASGLSFVTLRGRFGGSALAAAAVNALALGLQGRKR